MSLILPSWDVVQTCDQFSHRPDLTRRRFSGDSRPTHSAIQPSILVDTGDGAYRAAVSGPPPDDINVENDPLESGGSVTADLNVAATLFCTRRVNRMGSLGN